MSIARDADQRRARRVASFLIIAATFLGGCASQQRPLDAQKQEDKAAAAQAEKITGSIDDARCQSFGYKPGSSAYAQCRKELESEREQLGSK